MGVAHHVGEALAYDPAEQLLVRGVDGVDGAREVGGDAGGPEQLPAGGELAGERDVAVVGHGRADVGERPPGQLLDLGDLLLATGPDRLRRAGAPARP